MPLCFGSGGVFVSAAGACAGAVAVLTGVLAAITGAEIWEGMTASRAKPTQMIPMRTGGAIFGKSFFMGVLLGEL